MGNAERAPLHWRNNKQRLQFRGEKCGCGEKTFADRNCCPGCREVTFKPYTYRTIKDKEKSSKVLLHGNDGRIHSKCVPGQEKYLKHPISETTSKLEGGNGKTKELIEEMILVEVPDLMSSGNGGNGKESHVAELMEEVVER